MIDTAARIRQLQESKRELETAKLNVKSIRASIRHEGYLLAIAGSEASYMQVEAIKELQGKLDAAKEEVKRVEAFIEQLCI